MTGRSTNRSRSTGNTAEPVPSSFHAPGQLSRSIPASSDDSVHQEQRGAFNFTACWHPGPEEQVNMAWQALPQQLAQLPLRQQHRQAKPCQQRHSHCQTRAAVLSTPMEEQAQRKSTLDKLQSAVTITAAKTPYLENGKIDLREYDRLVERQIEGGVEGVIVGGTTGEGQVHCPPNRLSPG